MAYQVLARKWRPRNFSEVMGQQHVLQALSNALDQGRLHHAYLFSGTRGVGKTTIARILAKCLNCEEGISSHPCGQCATCREIDQGNFVDLLEIDAASRTKVEDTRDLLDNVQYKPSRGRFKIYLIDEVHMLSRHSFNALLKTLEEPPEHVKFLLATTDPQKLPITVLSRCLQFHLKAMTMEQITEQLQHVLTAETIPFDSSSLQLLASAAQGSMRDALSLTDQAIAYGNGVLQAEVIQQMLGTLDHRQLYQLLLALSLHDGVQLMQQIAELAALGPDFDRVLSELASVLHQISVCQLLGRPTVVSMLDVAAIQQLAQAIPADVLQLYYQICLQGRKELPLAPDGRCALEMTFLRMLAFVPRTAAGMGDISSGSSNSLPQRLERTDSTAHAILPTPTPTPTPESLAAEQSALMEQAQVMRPQPVAPGTDTAPVSSAQGLQDVLQVRNQLRSRRLREEGRDENLTAEPFRQRTDSASIPDEKKNSAITGAPHRTVTSAPVVPRLASISASSPSTDLPPWSQDDIPPLSDDIPPFCVDGAGSELPQSYSPPGASPAQQFAAPQQNRSESVPMIHQPSVLSQSRMPAKTIQTQESDAHIWHSDELLVRSSDDWARMIPQLQVFGRVRQLAMQSVLLDHDATQWHLQIRKEFRHLTQQKMVETLTEALSALTNVSVQIHIDVVDNLVKASPAEIEHIEWARLQQEAEDSLVSDPIVQILQQQFGATLERDTIQPLKNAQTTLGPVPESDDQP